MSGDQAHHFLDVRVLLLWRLVVGAPDGDAPTAAAAAAAAGAAAGQAALRVAQPLGVELRRRVGVQVVQLLARVDAPVAAARADAGPALQRTTRPTLDPLLGGISPSGG